MLLVPVGGVGVAQVEPERQPLVEARVREVPVEPGLGEGRQVVGEHDEVVRVALRTSGGRRLDRGLQAVPREAGGVRPAHENGGVADAPDVFLGLGPRRVDAQEDVQRPEDGAGFVVDLPAQAEQHEGGAVVVVRVFVLDEYAIIAWAEDDGIDLVADFGRQAEKPYRFLSAAHDWLRGCAGRYARHYDRGQFGFSRTSSPDAAELQGDYLNSGIRWSSKTIRRRSCGVPRPRHESTKYSLC